MTKGYDDEVVRRAAIERFPEGPKEFVMRVTMDMQAERLWGLVAGLMAGIAALHGVQPAAAWTGLLPWQGKLWVALAGAVLYSATLVLLLLQSRHPRLGRAGLWVAVVGPCAGLVAVVAGSVLYATGMISVPFRGGDAFQIAGGLLQVPALAIAVYLLRRPR